MLLTMLITLILSAMVHILNMRMCYISGDIHPAIDKIFNWACRWYRFDLKWMNILFLLRSWAIFYLMFMSLYIPILNLFIALCVLFMNHSMVHLKHPIRLLKICFRKKAY